MNRRGTIIAILVAIELAICGEAVVAVGGGRPGPWSARGLDAQIGSGPRLAEGGSHRVFPAGPHPALTVDIGYADLTIDTNATPQIDVSVSPSSNYGLLRAKAPLTARDDGGVVRIATSGDDGFAIGDDRMVTVVVPPETQVTVVHAGDIKAEGLRAKAAFHSVGRGSITIDDYAAPTLVATSSGRIALHGIVADRVEATSDDNRIEGTDLRVRDGVIESDGRVSLGFAKGSDTLVTAATDDGSVQVAGFAAGAASAASPKGGDDSDAAAETLKIGDGAGHVDVHTSDGNIYLTQEGQIP